MQSLCSSCSSGTLASSALNVLTGQRVHVAEAASLYFPALQIAHVLAIAAPTASLAFPAAQSTQADAPSPSKYLRK